MSNLKCVNPEIGQMLAVFELGELEPDDQQLFEAHLSECEYCLSEIQEMLPFYMKLHSHQEEVNEILREEGLTFDELKNRLLSRADAEAKTTKVGDRISDLAESLIEIGLLIFEPFKITARELVPLPATGYVFTKSGKDTKPREKVDLQDAEFKSALELYRSGEYGLAGDKLQTIVQNRLKDYELWFYLGVCRFLEKRALEAIDALTTAKGLAEDEFIMEIRWYLAQSYLLDGNIREATELLVWLKDQSGEKYPELARKLLSGIQSQNPIT